MGGKQKRAAKYKRWIQFQNKQTVGGKGSEIGCCDRTDSCETLDYSDTISAPPTPELPPIPAKVRQEVLKHRQKKTGRAGIGKGSWITHQTNRFCKVIDAWPAWPFTFFMMISLYVLVFFLLRNLIQAFTPEGYVEMDRKALYNGLKRAAPNVVYKMVLVMDYLFMARELSIKALYDIIFPPEEYYKVNRKRMF